MKGRPRPYRPFYNWFFASKKDVKSNPKVNYIMTEEESNRPLPEVTFTSTHPADGKVTFIDVGGKSVEEIQKLIKDYPTADPILAEVQAIEKRQFTLLEKKHKMYGTKNLAYGKTDMQDPENIKQSMRAITIRLQDKLSRLAVLIDHIGQSNPDELDESITDTLDDISNYGKLGSVIASGKWVTGEK